MTDAANTLASQAGIECYLLRPLNLAPPAFLVIIRNISETGAAIEVNSPLWFPDQFTLRMDRDGSRRPCHTVWRRDKRIGLQFD